MIRIALGAMLAVSASGLLFANPDDVSLTKPAVVCPKTRLGDEKLQADYDALWKAYGDQVDAATKRVQDELHRHYETAKSAGNLDLALFWDAMRKAFAADGKIRWEPTRQKKEWKRFGEVEFPDGLRQVLESCDAEYDEAHATLKQGYKALEVALTKADKLDQAVAIRTECQGLWPQAEPPNPDRTTAPPTPEPQQASLELLEALDVEGGRSHDCWKMVGKCLHCTGEEIKSFTSFMFRNPQIERLVASGEYDLEFQMTIVPPREKFGSDVVLLLPSIPGSPKLWFRHYWKQGESKVMFTGGGRDAGDTKWKDIDVTSPVAFDRAKRIPVKIKVRRKGRAVTVLLNGRAVIDCNTFADLPTSRSLGFSSTLETQLTVCEMTLSEPGK